MIYDILYTDKLALSVEASLTTGAYGREEWEVSNVLTPQGDSLMEIFDNCLPFADQVIAGVKEQHAEWLTFYGKDAEDRVPKE